MGPGGFCGLQNRCPGAFALGGGFDSLALPPSLTPLRCGAKMAGRSSDSGVHAGSAGTLSFFCPTYVPQVMGGDKA
jgi:hypothetical protein